MSRNSLHFLLLYAARIPIRAIPMSTGFVPMDAADIYDLYASRTPAKFEPPPDIRSPQPSRGLAGPRRMGPREDQYRSGQRGTGLHPVEEYLPQPFEDQFASSDGLYRHRSTKELIGRFEALAEASTSSLNQIAPNPRTSLHVPPAKAEKKSSPLRLSIRNIISVFKKGQKPVKERDDLPSFDVPPGSEEPENHSANAPSRSKLCASPTYAIRSGVVLYLQRPEAGSHILSVWSECECTLHSTHLLLSHKSSTGVPSTKVLSLGSCTSVHSVPLRSLPAEEQGLMPTMDGAWSPNVFDVVFNGKPMERFAVATAKERSGWVSDIW